jgi:hypothetical protein
MTRLAELQLLGPLPVFIAVLTAETAAYLLAANQLGVPPALPGWQ